MQSNYYLKYNKYKKKYLNLQNNEQIGGMRPLYTGLTGLTGSTRLTKMYPNIQDTIRNLPKETPLLLTEGPHNNSIDINNSSNLSNNNSSNSSDNNPSNLSNNNSSNLSNNNSSNLSNNNSSNSFNNNSSTSSNPDVSFPFKSNNSSSKSSSSNPEETTFFFVRHAQSCSNLELGYKSSKSVIGNLADKVKQKTSQPPLSEVGCLQASLLSLEIPADNNYKYYCSPSTRTIQTALIALESKYRNDGDRRKEITIVENLIEIGNYADLAGQDYQNKALDIERTQLITTWLKKWLNSNYLEYFPYCDYKLLELHKHIKDLIPIMIEIYRIKKSTKIDIENEIISDQKLFKALEDNLKILLQDHLELKVSRKSILDKICRLLNECIPIFSEETNFNLQEDAENKRQQISDINIKLGQYRSETCYYTRSDRFDFVKFKFNKEIPLGKDKKNNLQMFIEHVSLTGDKENFCFSHGSLLHEFFKLDRKMNNTEIVRCKCIVTKKENELPNFFKSSKLLQSKYEIPLSLSLPIGERESREDLMCGNLDDKDNIHLFGITDTMARDGYANKLTKKNVHRMFHLPIAEEDNGFKTKPNIEVFRPLKVVGKLVLPSSESSASSASSASPSLKVVNASSKTVDDFLVVPSAAETRSSSDPDWDQVDRKPDEWFKKYLKYKQKYLNLQNK